ncbi:MAG: fluoroacetyl-CoA thioesterase, partial [Actinomycetota bacterium]|nr:fluoroacetyl-CoA thioesterase [Actinomycetota bacterium]
MTFTVAAEDTAEALGSGDLPVLGTPRLLAWCEAATCVAARTALQPGQTTVGSRIALLHLRPTPLGEAVTVHATPLGADGRMLRFEVRATDARG